MSAEAPQPNLQEQLDQAVEAARQATKQVDGAYDLDILHRGQTTDEHMQVGHTKSSPSIGVSEETGIIEGKHIDAKASTVRRDLHSGFKPKNAINADYHAIIGERDYKLGDGPELVHGTTVRRYDNEGQEVYRHSFKNRATAQKFGALIAKQVTHRAEAAQSEQKRQAA